MEKLYRSLRTRLRSTCSELLGVDLWVEWVPAAAPLPNPLSLRIMIHAIGAKNIDLGLRSEHVGVKRIEPYWGTKRPFVKLFVCFKGPRCVPREGARGCCKGDVEC